MKIKLTDGYYIAEDNYNYILKQDYIGTGKKDKEQKLLTRTVGYFSNGIKGLEGCIKRYLEECSLDTQKSAEIDFKNFCEALEAVVAERAVRIAQKINECICQED